MNKLGNYVTGKWIQGDGDGQVLFNAANGAPIYQATTRALILPPYLNMAEKRETRR